MGMGGNGNGNDFTGIGGNGNSKSHSSTPPLCSPEVQWSQLDVDELAHLYDTELGAILDSYICGSLFVSVL